MVTRAANEVLICLLDKYEPHEIVSLLESYYNPLELLAPLADIIEDQFCDEGAFEDEWRGFDNEDYDD